MLNQLIDKLNKQELNYPDLFHEISIPAKTVLINEGETSKHIYFVQKGCLRLWFNNQGKDITFQFFFEGQGVSCLLGREPSPFTLEALEPSTVVVLKKKDFDRLMNEFPEMKNDFIEILLTRLENYSRLFLSRIKNNPQERYEELMKENPEIFQRIPLHYIASYLGITSVSLSRIRNRKK